MLQNLFRHNSPILKFLSSLYSKSFSFYNMFQCPGFFAALIKFQLINNYNIKCPIKILSNFYCQLSCEFKVIFTYYWENNTYINITIFGCRTSSLLSKNYKLCIWVSIFYSFQTINDILFHITLPIRRLLKIIS